MHRIMHRSHVGDNRVVFADRVAALPRKGISSPLMLRVGDTHCGSGLVKPDFSSELWPGC